MKAYITFFVIVLLAPVISLQAQSNLNVKHSNSYPQSFIVRTVSGHGFIPETSIGVTDSKGRSISCKARDRDYKNLSKQHCDTDSLIKNLETCTNCKIVKIKAQLDALYKAMKMGTLKCASGYGVPVYAMYTKKADGSLQLINKVAKGCGKTDNDNKLIDELIAEFEKTVDKNGLMEPNETASAKESKPVSDTTDKNFVQEAGGDSAAGFGIKAIITTDGMLRLTSKGELTRVEVAFYKPAIIRIIGEKERRDYSPGEHYSHMYQLKKKSGSDLYYIDIHDERYKEMNKLVINLFTSTGRKPLCTLVNSKVPLEIKKVMYFDDRFK